MPLPFGMVGSQENFLLNVYVGVNSLLNMPYSVIEEVFPLLRHDNIRDLTASLLTEVCSNVSVEPELQELSGETLGRSANKESGARADIAVDGFWECGRARTFCDIRVFNPFAPSNKKTSIASSYRSQEKKKKRHYNQRITEVEHGSFSPLIFSSTGVWDGKQLFSIRGLHPCYLRNGTSIFPSQWAGYVAYSHFHYYTLQFSVSEELVPLKVVQCSIHITYNSWM